MADTAEHTSLLARLRRGALEALILRALGLGLLFLMFTSISRRIGVEQFGTFSYVYMLASTLAFIAPLGWPNAAMRFVREYLDRSDWPLLRGMLIRSHQVTLVTSLAASALLVGLSYLPIRESLAVSFRYAALVLPLLALVYLRRKIFQALDQIRASLLVQDVLPPLLVILALFFVTVHGPLGAVLLFAAASLSSFLLASLWLHQGVPEEGRSASPAWRTRLWMSVAWPMLLGSVSQILMSRTDTLMLGFLLDMESVGQYVAALQIATLIVFVLNAVNVVTAPQLASAYQNRDALQFRRILKTSAIWSTLGALPIFTFLVLFPKPLLSLFGSDFIAGGWLLRILACGQLISAITGSVGFALLMSDRERQFASSMTVIAVVNIIGNVIVIPSFGAIGASIVTAGSLAILNIWQFWLARQIFPTKAAI